MRKCEVGGTGRFPIREFISAGLSFSSHAFYFRRGEIGTRHAAQKFRHPKRASDDCSR